MTYQLGEMVKVKSKGLHSWSAQCLQGQFGTIVKVGYGFVCLDIESLDEYGYRGGLWVDEIEPVGLNESDFEWI